jgi:hypothetical protein
MRPPWDRKRRALPKLPKGQVRVQVKVIEVGGGAASYRRSKSYTFRAKTFTEVCHGIAMLIDVWARAQPLRVVPPPSTPSGGLTPPAS